MSDPKLAGAKTSDMRASTKGGISTLFRRKKKEEDLDPALAAVHLSFAEMRKKDWRAAVIESNASFGLGLTLAANPRGKGAIIDSISFGGPAAEAKVLREGDLLIKINNHDCMEMSHQEVLRLLLDSTAGGPVEVEVICLDSKDKSDTVSMRGDDDEPTRAPRPSGLSNPGLAGSRTSIQSVASGSPSSASTVSTSSTPAALSAAAAAGYVDLLNGPLNQNIVSEVHLLRPGGGSSSGGSAAPFARTLTGEEQAKRDDELRRKGYILPDEIATTNTKKATALPVPRPESATNPPMAPQRPNASPIPGGQRSPLHTISPPASSSTPPVSQPHSGYQTPDSISLTRGRSISSAPAVSSGPQPQYFIGPANSDTAATVLQSKEEGAYVLRESLRGKGEYAITVKFGGTFHQIAITRDAQGYRIGRAHAFPTINQLIKFYSENSLDQHFSALKTTLVHPRGSLDFVG